MWQLAYIREFLSRYSEEMRAIDECYDWLLEKCMADEGLTPAEENEVDELDEFANLLDDVVDALKVIEDKYCC